MLIEQEGVGLMGDEKLLKEIGQRIFVRRKELQFTQEYVADQMNVSVQMISNLEGGKKAIRPENLVKVCNVLDVSTDYILTGNRSEAEVTQLAAKLSQLQDEDYHAISVLIDSLLKK